MANRMREDDYEFHPDKEKLCGYKYALLSIPPEYCGLQKEEGKDRCIFHLHEENKDLGKFIQGIKIQQSKQNEKYDFEGYCFPKKFDFSEIYPFGQSHNQIIIKKRDLNESVNFINCIFNCFTRFSDINFQKPVNFGLAIFNNWSEFCHSIFIDSNFNSVHFNDIALIKDTTLRHCSFRNVDLSKVSFQKSSLEYVDLEGIEFSDVTKEKIYMDTYTSNTNRIFAREAADFNYLEELKLKNRNKFWFKIWKLTSDYGRSIPRWISWCLGIILLFTFFFCVISKPSMSFWSALFSSITLFTTLGFGDIPFNAIGPIRVFAIIEVILGYIMLGVLISIFSEKVARRS